MINTPDKIQPEVNLPATMWRFIDVLPNFLNEIKMPIKINWQILPPEVFSRDGEKGDKVELTIFGSMPGHLVETLPQPEIKGNYAYIEHSTEALGKTTQKMISKDMIGDQEQLVAQCKFTLYAGNPTVIKLQAYDMIDRVIGLGLTSQFYAALDQALEASGFETVFQFNNSENVDFFVDKARWEHYENASPASQQDIQAFLGYSHVPKDVTVREY